LIAPIPDGVKAGLINFAKSQASCASGLAGKYAWGGAKISTVAQGAM